jgi:hypothetical protein
MSNDEKEFAEYFKRKLAEERQTIENLPYTIEQLRNIYRQEFERKKSLPQLELKMEAQALDYNMVQYFLPEKWEMFDGMLLGNKEELINVLRLLIYNLGVRATLDALPYELIKDYIENWGGPTDVVDEELFELHIDPLKKEKKEFLKELLREEIQAGDSLKTIQRLWCYPE